MAPSLFAHSIVIHFSLTKGNEEQQQQPFPLQATTPKHIYIYSTRAQISNESTEKQDDEQLVLLQSTTPPQISTSCFIQTPHIQFPSGIVFTSLVPLYSNFKFIFVDCHEIDLLMHFFNSLVFYSLQPLLLIFHSFYSFHVSAIIYVLVAMLNVYLLLCVANCYQVNKHKLMT
ncbi:hypothetical protein NC653_041236 [Populus alba x Populus x berolinensis]|uniref:Uncharacterized protein n=1 Tax=Populus alba x Populus x berolinensis TaxID=444605 RepID=A0AAD6LAF2_9ROSI|nr:hypothetical protein NC653_041236 [Populus alba x Populus x berolinensis]